MHSENGLPLEGRKPASRSTPGRPLADREVPLPASAPRVLSPAVHAWLDGDLPEGAVCEEDARRDVEFWKALGQEMERRRHLAAPPTLPRRIMEALPPIERR
ncbi:MAG TPA: hypothetical protein VJU87_12080 [Gemmatimonadaceae bacterium]|nr:hypothetical protein [Gemmatimonadaceae bacterium]